MDPVFISPLLCFYAVLLHLYVLIKSILLFIFFNFLKLSHYISSLEFTFSSNIIISLRLSVLLCVIAVYSF